MQTVTIGPYQVCLKLRPNARARRLILRLDGPGLVLTLPPLATQKDVDKFLRDHEHKIIKLLDKRPTTTVKPDATIEVLHILGKLHKVKIDPMRTKGIWPEGNILWIGGKSKYPHKVLEQWLVTLAHGFFSFHANNHAKKLGCIIRDIKIRDMKTRWGSCRSDGSITFSWRLLLAPRAVAEYVSFHEICHLKEMNHGPKFWKLVETFCPDHKHHRKWLRTEGKILSQVKLEGFLPANNLSI